MNYYEKKDFLKEKAKSHVSDMNLNHSSDIKFCVDTSKIYESDVDTSDVTSTNNITTFSVVGLSSEVAVSKCKDKVCILNFASYKNPGGRFMDGSSAQEEMLCHSSILYNVLSNERFMNDFYKPNKSRLNRALYHNNLIFTPNVLFTSCGKYADVITCAAPNFGVYRRYNKVDRDMYLDLLRSRIDHVLYCAYKEGVTTLVLGAWGCGVFKNNPDDVAGIMYDLLTKKYKGVFKEVLFPIPDGKNRNVFIKYFIK